MCREKAGGQDEMRMLRAMYAEGEERLRQAGIEEAGLDAWYLLEFVTGVDKAHYYMEPDRRMEQSVAQEYEKVVNLRAEHPGNGYIPVCQCDSLYGASDAGEGRLPAGA